MGAFPIALGAISSVASTASSFSGGTSYNTKAMEQVSLDQVSYLEERQKKKEALTLEMMDTAKNFANANFNNELSQLDLLRQQQEIQLQQQNALADYNYANTQATLDNQQYLYNVQNKYEDYQKAQAYQSTMYGLQAGKDARTVGLVSDEQGRDINLNTAEGVRQLSSMRGRAAFNQDRTSSQLNQLTGLANYQTGEANRDLELSQAVDTSQLGRYAKLSDLQAQQSSLDSQESGLNIQASGVEQSAAAQSAQNLMSLGSDLNTLSDASKQALSEASKRMITRGNSSSDRSNYLTDSKIVELQQASAEANIQSAVARGLIDSATGVSLASIKASQADIAKQRLALQNDSNIDEQSRRLALSQLGEKQKLTSLTEAFQYLTLPFIQGSINDAYSKQQNIDFVEAQNSISRASDQAQYNLANRTGRTMYDLQNTSDQYNMDVATRAYRADAGYSDIMRQQDYDTLNYANQQAYAENQQAQSNVDYGSQLINKNYELGKYSAEADRLSTMSAADLKQAAYLAQQRTALASALSGIQTGMLSSGTGGGGDWGSGISSLFGGLSSLFSKNQTYQAQNNYLNRMSNLGGSNTNTGTGTSGTSYGTWNSGTSGRW